MSTLPGWETLLTADGLARLVEIEAGIASGQTALHIGARLRADGFSPDEVAALLTQSELRRKAASKFGPLASRLLFTPAGLEQATRAPVAALHAKRFVAAGCSAVADLGCGIGAESLSFLAAGLNVRAVELDPFTAAVAEHNLTQLSASEGAGSVQCADVTEITLDEKVDGAFLDPARRTSGHHNTRRLTSPNDYSPPLDFAFGLAAQFPTGVKLGPGLDRDLIPDDAEAQWVSVDGQLVETGLWFGAVARPGIHRAALVIRGEELHELTAAADAADAPAAALGEYLSEPDGAVIRARLIGLLAAQLDAGMLSDGIAYLTSDRFVPSPFATTFQVVEELPVREKELRRALAARDIGTLEIKKRGADVDPAGLRTRLKLKGTRQATLILTRAAGRHVALLAERLPHV